MKTIYYNGAVYTGQLPLAEAFVEESGVFTFAGSNEEAVKMAESGDRLVDLKGNFVCSGFNDSHMHLPYRQPEGYAGLLKDFPGKSSPQRERLDHGPGMESGLFFR